MKLINCNHCGRPFYDDAESCPYCGHATHLSATNLVTRSISDPKSHKLMEEVLSGNYHPEPERAEPAVAPTPVVTEPPAPVTEIPPAPEPQPQEVEQPETPSESVQERAENIAAAANHEGLDGIEDDMEEPNQIETIPAPRKRRVWIWIIVIILILAIAAAAYLEWDFIVEKAKALLN